MACPLCRSGQRAMSPAAKMSGALVARKASTARPRSILRPAFSASSRRGRTPTPMTTRSASSVPPLFSVAFLPSMPATVSSRWKTTPCSSCKARTKSPIPGPRMRSIGRFSGATTWTSRPRWRSDAATSSPMKLAPITRARLADLACSMIARLSARLRRVRTQTAPHREWTGAPARRRSPAAGGRRRPCCHRTAPLLRARASMLATLALRRRSMPLSL